MTSLHGCWSLQNPEALRHDVNWKTDADGAEMGEISKLAALQVIR
jgi:hypothetical protein